MNKEELQKIVNESKYFKDVMQKLGLNTTYGYEKLHKLLDEYEIDYSNISKNKGTQGCIINYSLDEILIENSPYINNGPKLKDKLIEASLKENKCELCGQLPFHNGKELVLQLHHINGIHNDNRLENLQILCPNCHSQTENYGGKNIKIEKKKYYCPKCGREMYKGAKLCSKCSGEEHRKTIRPLKEELLELIKTKPFTEIGRMYGVSDNAVRKWCKSEGLPHLKSEIKKLIS